MTTPLDFATPAAALAPPLSPFELSAAALADAEANLAEKVRLRQATDTRAAEAQAANVAAVDAHSALAGRIAAGEVVSAKETATAAAAVRDTETHLSLAKSAQAIATAKEAEYAEVHARARFAHSKWTVAAKHSERAVACRALAKAADDFGDALGMWQEAGEALFQAKQDALVARTQRLGPAAAAQLLGSGSFDSSTTAIHRGCAALPAAVLHAAREYSLDHVDMLGEANRADSEAARLTR